ncbi:MAG: Tol-Pal system beta propeller repeat protein TolB [Nitrospirae bacterium]|nr:Tol-Pal system beta propeller repeat protein TolB [Nitrospirota bacterium]
MKRQRTVHSSLPAAARLESSRTVPARRLSRVTASCGILLLLAACCSLTGRAEAKVYIDITAPALKKLPIAVSEFAGPSGKELSNILRDDLDFTGIFHCLDRGSFIEAPSQPFNQKNWTVIGAEAVVKGVVSGTKNKVATVSLYDAVEGKEILRKEYQTEASLLRPLAHTIANDIYRQLTGEAGIFRTRIAYVVRRGAEDSLTLADWDGHRAGAVGVSGNVIMTPRWSRDGSRLLYSSERKRQWGIYVLDFRKRTETRAFASKGTNIAGDFSPDAGEFLFSSSLQGNQDLYTYNISASRLSRLTSSRNIEVSPSLSPDGSRIAFVSDRDRGPQIFVMGRDGHNARRITFNGPYNTSPSWSPRGDKIVFSGRQGGKNQIFTINPDGSGPVQLTDRGNNEDPSFSPDGRYIVFSSDRDGGKAIYIMRANGEAQKRITPPGVRAFGPRWSTN